MVTGLFTTLICTLHVTEDHLLYVPVIVLKPRSPVGRAQQRLQDARQVDERVTHQQEHGQERSEIVDVSNQYAALTHGYSY